MSPYCDLASSCEISASSEVTSLSWAIHSNLPVVGFTELANMADTTRTRASRSRWQTLTVCAWHTYMYMYMYTWVNSRNRTNVRAVCLNFDLSSSEHKSHARIDCLQAVWTIEAASNRTATIAIRSCMEKLVFGEEIE